MYTQFRNKAWVQRVWLKNPGWEGLHIYKNYITLTIYHNFIFSFSQKKFANMVLRINKLLQTADRRFMILVDCISFNFYSENRLNNYFQYEIYNLNLLK